jgi:hypothetical protein
MFAVQAQVEALGGWLWWCDCSDRRQAIRTANGLSERNGGTFRVVDPAGREVARSERRTAGV